MAEFAQVLIPDQTVETIKGLVAALAKDAIKEVDGVGITERAGQGWETKTYTDDWALKVDEVQYELGDGPCIGAVQRT